MIQKCLQQSSDRTISLKQPFGLSQSRGNGRNKMVENNSAKSFLKKKKKSMWKMA
jgi:hypothetical protein